MREEEEHEEGSEGKKACSVGFFFAVNSVHH